MTPIQSVTRLSLGAALLAPAMAAGADKPVLEEVLVVAQKRVQDLQSTPLSITAFSGRQANASQINSIEAVANYSPGLHIDAFPASQPRPFIRGVGSGDTGAGGDQSVAFYVDEVYMSRPGMLTFDSFDLERLEVLKGPQGTLWGKNVAGGLIHVIHNRPQDGFDAKVQGTAGNEGIVNLSGMLNMPLGDSLLTRFVISSRQHDGFAENINTGNELFDEDHLSGRAMFLYRPNDDMELEYIYSAAEEDNAGSARNQFDGEITDLPRDPDGDIRKTTGEIDGYDRRDTRMHILKFDWRNELADLHVIGAYRELDLDYLEDLDGNNIDDFDGVNGNFIQLQRGSSEDSEAASLEARLSSPETGGLFWQLGAYYEEVDIKQRTQGTLAALGGTEIGITTNETESAAVFGELVYPLTDRVNLTGGLRWGQDEKTNTQDTSQSTFPLTIDAPYDEVEASNEWDEVTWKVTLDAQFNEQLFGYATVSTGYKAGGYQDVAPNPRDAVTSFDPESVINYELGIKSELWDGRARVNASTYFMDYEDLQVRQVDGTVTLTTNAGAAEIKGFELDASILPTDGLSLGVKYSYLDTEFTDFVQDGVDYSGNRLSRAPENSYTLHGAYTLPVGNGDLTFSTDYSWTDDQFEDNSNLPPEIVHDYGLLDARIAYETGPWNFSVWGKNLTDEEFATHYVSFAGISFVSFNAPATYGVTVSWSAL